MIINTALILCAGYGKRLNPITLDTPKPLLELHNVTMLEKCIQLIKSLGIKKILINSFYLKDHFPKFFKDFGNKVPEKMKGKKENFKKVKDDEESSD